MRKEHGYGELISSINFEQDVFHEIDKKHLKKGLGKLLAVKGKVAGKRKGKITHKRGIKKAEQYLNGGIDEKRLIELVKEGIEEGYIWKFKLESPWHPAIYFDENRLTTVPWQHRKAVLYSGRKEYEFYSKDFLRESGKFIEKIGLNNVNELHNAESVLKTGYIKPGVQHASNSEEAEKLLNENNDQSRAWAIFLSATIPKAAIYAGHSNYSEEVTSPVLELEVPSKFLRMPISGSKFITGLEDYFERFSNPKKLQNAYFGSSEEFQYKNSQNSNEIVLPLNYVNGVYDREMFDEPYFTPLDEYIEYLYDRIPERLPAPNEIKLDVGAKNGYFKRNSSIEVEEKKFLKFVKQIEEPLEKSYKYILKLKKAFHKLKTEENLGSEKKVRFDKSRDEEFHWLLKDLERFTKRRNEILEGLNNTKFEPKDGNRELINFLISRDYSELKQFTDTAIKDIERIKRIELSQAIETKEDQKSVEERFRNDINKIVSLRFEEDSLNKLARYLAHDKKEFVKFKEEAKQVIS